MTDSAAVVWVDQFVSGYAWNVAVGSSSVYVVGATGQLEGTTGLTDAFIRKYTANGSIVWIREFTTQDIRENALRLPAYAHAVAVDFTGVYVVGKAGYQLPYQTATGGSAFIRSAFIRKYDPNGGILWTREFGTESAALGVAVYANAVYVVGTIHKPAEQVTAGGQLDAFVRKHDAANGNEIWARQFGSTGDVVASQLAVNSRGVFVVGRTFGTLPRQSSRGAKNTLVSKYTATKKVTWADQVSAPRRLQEVRNTSILLPRQSNDARSDAFIRKYTANGNAIWTHQFGTPGHDEATGVDIDAAGVYLVAHSLPPEVNAALVRKYDFNGQVIWTSELGFSDIVGVGGVAVDPTGVHVAGMVLGPQDLGIFVRKYDAFGDELWTSWFGSPGYGLVHGMALDSGIYIVGETTTPFIAKLSPPVH